MIESARAGEAGLGFTVVASEVRGLADQTSLAAKDFVRQVGSVQSAARQSTAVMDSVGERIRAMDDMADGISIAVHGDASVNASGLSQMAEMLRAEVEQFLSLMRARGVDARKTLGRHDRGSAKHLRSNPLAAGALVDESGAVAVRRHTAGDLLPALGRCEQKGCWV
jgi:Methyl-accepting chemotaxis protein (MCP) signalling domain